MSNKGVWNFDGDTSLRAADQRVGSIILKLILEK
jgi:hypothetical protein